MHTAAASAANAAESTAATAAAAAAAQSTTTSQIRRSNSNEDGRSLLSLGNAVCALSTSVYRFNLNAKSGLYVLDVENYGSSNTDSDDHNEEPGSENNIPPTDDIHWTGGDEEEDNNGKPLINNRQLQRQLLLQQWQLPASYAHEWDTSSSQDLLFHNRRLESLSFPEDRTPSSSMDVRTSTAEYPDHVNVRVCWCTEFFQNRPVEFCPEWFDTCTVKGSEGPVECYSTTGTDTFVRSFWPVAIFWVFGLLYALTCSEPGTSAREYVRRKCCCCRHKRTTVNVRPQNVQVLGAASASATVANSNDDEPPSSHHNNNVASTEHTVSATNTSSGAISIREENDEFQEVDINGRLVTTISEENPDGTAAVVTSGEIQPMGLTSESSNPNSSNANSDTPAAAETPGNTTTNDATATVTAMPTAVAAIELESSSNPISLRLTDKEQLQYDLDQLLRREPERAAFLYRQAVIRERRRERRQREQQIRTQRRQERHNNSNSTNNNSDTVWNRVVSSVFPYRHRTPPRPQRRRRLRSRWGTEDQTAAETDYSTNQPTQSDAADHTMTAGELLHSTHNNTTTASANMMMMSSNHSVHESSNVNNINNNNSLYGVGRLILKTRVYREEEHQNEDEHHQPHQPDQYVQDHDGRHENNHRREEGPRGNDEDDSPNHDHHNHNHTHHTRNWHDIIPFVPKREHVTLEEMDEEMEHGVRCAICLARLEDGEIIGDIPCGHILHKECLKDWLRRKNRCPLCQQTGIARLYDPNNNHTQRQSQRRSRYSQSVSFSSDLDNLPV